jgi:hypothetical protein
MIGSNIMATDGAGLDGGEERDVVARCSASASARFLGAGDHRYHAVGACSCASRARVDAW